MATGSSAAQPAPDYRANGISSLQEARDAAARAEKRLRDAIDVLPEGIVFLDKDGRYILWNQKYAEIYAKSADLLEPGVRLADTLKIGVQRGDYPEASGREEDWLRDRLSLLENPGVRHEQRLSNGRCIMIEERKTPDGETIGLRVDITELKEREESFRLLFEDNPVPLLVYDPETETIQAANDAAADHFGYSASQFEGLAAESLFEPDEWNEARQILSSSCSDKSRFWRQKAADGSRLETVLFTRQAPFAGRKRTIVSVFDVTERRRAEARMAHMARHDELTGLANRAHCREQLHDLISSDGQSRRNVTLALVDLDHFKAVNDTHGHPIGDALLAETSRRMMALLPRNALLCRVGGDEFAIIFRRASVDQVELVAKSIIEALSRPFFVADHCLHIGATIGSASAPDDCTDAETLMRYADLALYAAKSAKRGTYCRFESAMDAAAQERTKLENQFREAVHRGQLKVHYQPLINLVTGDVEGYEALLRWTHPEYGAVSPEVFIPLAEDMGLIDVVGQFVLQTACKEARNWPDNISVSVNVSPLQFRNGSVLNAVLQALSSAGLPPHRLELEITEAVLMDQGPHILSTIRSLRSMGIGLSMDDFGTGYSSLRYLLSYPFSKIKIDKSFLMNFDENGNSRSVVDAVIGLGNSLGLVVTAEGIEHETVRDYLKAVGCLQGQGYLFDKARPPEELAAYSADRSVA